MLAISADHLAATLPPATARFHVLAVSLGRGQSAGLAPDGLGLASGLVTLLAGGWAPPLADLSGTVCNACLWLVESLVGLARQSLGQADQRLDQPEAGVAHCAA